MVDEYGIVLPAGVERPEPSNMPSGRGLVVNESDLPDNVVLGAVETFFDERSSMLGANSPTTFQVYNQLGGSLLARSKFRVPQSVIEEIILARDMAERDDDIGAAIGAAIALGFGEGLQNTHEDEVVVAMFDEISKYAKLETRIFPEMYRELLIASQVTTCTIFIQKQIQFQPMGADRLRSRTIAQPVVGVIPAEQIRVLGNDLFGTAPLAYRPFTNRQEMWLEEYFNPSTPAGRKNDMRNEDPLLVAMVQEQVPYDDYMMSGMGVGVYGDPKDPPQSGRFVYKLNPNMVARSTFPKGQWPHPRPLLTRNFPLLEAKRLLNILDYGLLEGGANFLIVVKKGSDKLPAFPEEIINLRESIKRSARTGVIVGDHRLDVEIITPQLTELLNPQKRKLIARKLTAALLRIPDFQDADTGGAATASSESEVLSRVISADRSLLAEHIECNVYDAASDRNGESLAGSASLWFPKIILQGAQYFTDMVLKLRDRGDISRKSTTQAAGFSYTAEVQQRKMEKASGDDRILTPPPVPFTGQGGGLNDNGGGRPAGGSSANGAPGSAPKRSTQDSARPRQLVARNAGETVRSVYESEDDNAAYWRVGAQTAALLDEYAASAREGRITQFERDALTQIGDGAVDAFREGTVTVIPVNPDDEIVDVKAVRLEDGISMLVGRRLEDGAVMARALCFRAPKFKAADADELATRWGWYPREVGSPVVD